MVLELPDMFERSQLQFLGLNLRYATIIVAHHGEGDTDDIQEAIRLLPAEGGVVQIREGDYTINSTILIDKDNVTLRGVGKGTKIIGNFDDQVIEASSQTGILIENLFVEGSNNASNTSNDGIFLSACTDSIVTNCWVEKCHNGILVYNSSATDEYNIIANCWSSNNKAAGIDVLDSDRVNVLNCICKSNTTMGISIRSQHCTVQGNICANNTTSGITNYSSFAIIDSNQCLTNIQNGILTATNSDDSVISNNICEGNDSGAAASYSGIKIFNDKVVVTGNRCSNNGDYGIEILATADKTLVMNNICVGNTTGAINDGGSNTYPNGASGTNNLALDDLNIIA